MYSSGTAQAVAHVHQLLVEMLPRRWSSVRLDVERDDAGRFARLANLEAEVGPGGGSPPPRLGRDQAAIVAEMNGALGIVAGDLDESWSGVTARMDRGDDGSATLVLLAADGAEQRRLVLAPDAVGSLLLSDELFDAFDATRDEGYASQSAFQTAIQGYQRWDADPRRQELAFVLPGGRAWKLRAQAVGSWSAQNGTWMWAWGNDSIDAAFASASARVRDGAAARRGLAALTTPAFAAPRAFAVELALHAAVAIGARGVFPGPADATLFFVAAMEGVGLPE